MAASELVLRIDGDTRKWESALRRVQGSTAALGRGAISLARRTGDMLGAVYNSAGYRRVTQGLSRAVANPLTAMLGGAAILKATHDLVQFDSAVARVAINGNLSAQEQAKLRDEITATAIATGQSREQLVEYLRAMPEDLQFARSVLRDTAVTATATGASLADLGSLTDNLQEKMGLARDEIQSAFALLVGQGKVGGMTLDKLAGTSDRLFAAAQRVGSKGMGGLAEFGALLQIASKSAGGGERGMMAVETILNDIVEKRKQIGKYANVDVFKPGSRTELKSIGEILKGIVKGTGGNVVKLEEIFGPGSMRVMTALVEDYKQTGGFALFDKLVDGGDKMAVMKDFARYTEEAAHQLNVFKAVGAEFATAAIAPGLKEVSDRMREIVSDPQKLDAMRKAFVQFGADVSQVITATLPLLKMLAASAEGWNKIFYHLRDNPEKELQRTKDSLSTDALFDQLPLEERKRIGQRNFRERGFDMRAEVIATLTRLKLQQQNNINVNVNVAADGRTATDVDAPNAQVKATTNRGSLAFGGSN